MDTIQLATDGGSVEKASAIYDTLYVAKPGPLNQEFGSGDIRSRPSEKFGWPITISG